VISTWQAHACDINRLAVKREAEGTVGASVLSDQVKRLELSALSAIKVLDLSASAPNAGPRADGSGDKQAINQLANDDTAAYRATKTSAHRCCGCAACTRSWRAAQRTACNRLFAATTTNMTWISEGIPSLLRFAAAQPLHKEQSY